MKKIFILFFAIIFLIGSQRFIWDKLTDSFHPRKIYYSKLKKEIDEISTYKKESISKILSQDFYYLAKGHHAYAFVSKDNLYILKFPRFSKFETSFWHRYNPFFKNRIKQKTKNKRNRIKYIINSHDIANNSLCDETATIYLHFKKTSHIQTKTKIFDKLKRAFHLDLNSIGFVIQKNVTLFEDIFPDLIRKNDLKSIKKILDSYFDILESRASKKIMNKDRRGWCRNYGIDNLKKVKEIDIGAYKIKKDLNLFDEINQCSIDFRKYLLKNYPIIIPYFDEKLTSYNN
jgi:hypothetical protein